MSSAAISASAARARAAVLGGLIGDAAGLGVHWLYGDGGRVAKSLAPGESVEFLEPSEARYTMPAYFAHGRKRAGDLTHAGASSLVTLRELVRQRRWSATAEFHPAAFGASLSAYFGPGGDYRGYVDHALRETVRNVEDQQALKSFVRPEAPAGVDAAAAKAVGDKAVAVAKQVTGAAVGEVRTRIAAAVREVASGDAALVAYGEQVGEAALRVLTAPAGANDVQMNALGNLVPAVARFGARDDAALSQIERVVRSTQNADDAVAYTRLAARVLGAVIDGRDDLRALLEELHADVQHAEIADLWRRVRAAVDEEPDTVAVTGQFGRACFLRMGWPSIVHTLWHATSYTDGVRRALLSGGDSVSRAIFVGAVLAAKFGVGTENGVPLAWALRTFDAREAEQLAAQLTEA